MKNLICGKNLKIKEVVKNLKNGSLNIDQAHKKKCLNDEIVKNQIVVPFDHSTVLNINSPHVEIANELEKRGHKIVRVDYQPTCELMIQDFAKKIKKNLPKKIKLLSLKLKETDSSFAEWYSSDNEL